MNEGHREYSKHEISFDDLQVFLRSEEIDIPIGRRDISDPQNLRWLNRNLLMRNEEKVPKEYWEALKRALRETYN